MPFVCQFTYITLLILLINVNGILPSQILLCSSAPNFKTINKNDSLFMKELHSGWTSYFIQYDNQTVGLSRPSVCRY